MSEKYIAQKPQKLECNDGSSFFMHDPPDIETGSETFVDPTITLNFHASYLYYSGQKRENPKPN
jgi:hypothetical protein